MSDVEDLVEAAQPNELLRRVDALCEARRWDDLVGLAQRCREAVERGKQLWPIAEHIEYRLALEGPAPLAGSVLTPTAGRFALGPLTEVAASTHTFFELSPHLSSHLVAGVVAGERVLRGEELAGVPEAHPEVLELPMVLQDWEPTYELATYRSSKVTAPAPKVGPLTERGTGQHGEPIDDPELLRSLLDLVATWVGSSNGRSDAAVVEGLPEAAIGSLGEADFLIGELDPARAMALMAWAAAGGGAHGRRNGAAAGRSAAWWAATALVDLEWPPDPDHLGEDLARLRWFRWEPLRPLGGWQLHLAVEDPSGGWSAAIAAEDRATEP
ncbi:MAG TPA: hypothetical protein VM754_12310 [Actinomycetota bacterium]|nr:hypothetical protein [Actinomycetota bacterium]